MNMNNTIEKKKGVAFLINSMGGGGAEKVVQLLLEQLSLEKDINIILILLENKIVYRIPKTVKVISLFSQFNTNLHKFLGLFIGAVKLNIILKKYDIKTIISFMERSNFVNVFAKFFGRIHNAVISEHTNPKFNYSESNVKNRVVNLLIKTLYNRADKIIAATDGVEEALINIFGIDKKKIQVIYNPCNIGKIQSLSAEHVDHPWFQENIPIIINIGRLMKPKGQWHLIQTFADVRDIMNCRMFIIGEGDLRPQLENLTRDLKVQADIEFLGWQENPYKYMSKSTVFVLTSLWEGFGIVLVEAMICGLPIVSFDCDSGPREILNNGKYGILLPVGDRIALRDSIIDLLKNEELRDSYSRIAKVRAQRFSVDLIIENYKKCFDII